MALEETPNVSNVRGNAILNNIILQYCGDLENEMYDLAIVVVDAYVLERSILLCNQVLCVTDKVMIVINLYDEAYKRGMRIDEEKLNQYMKAPHSLMSAKKTEDMEKLKRMTLHLPSAFPVSKSPRVATRVRVLMVRRIHAV